MRFELCVVELARSRWWSTLEERPGQRASPAETTAASLPQSRSVAVAPAVLDRDLERSVVHDRRTFSMGLPFASSSTSLSR
jgi:hypothetical protein